MLNPKYSNCFPRKIGSKQGSWCKLPLRMKMTTKGFIVEAFTSQNSTKHAVKPLIYAVLNFVQKLDKKLMAFILQKIILFYKLEIRFSISLL